MIGILSSKYQKRRNYVKKEDLFINQIFDTLIVNLAHKSVRSEKPQTNIIKLFKNLKNKHDLQKIESVQVSS